MGATEFKSKLANALTENLNMQASEKQLEQMFYMFCELAETNKVMNLTAITDEDGVIFKHIVDSLMISPYIPSGASLVDVGCGAGFPTLPLAIMRPDLRITALDSTEKRVKYVARTAEWLGLANVRTVVGRAEELAHDAEYREAFDCATARAVAVMPMLAELTLPLVRVGGSLVAMKAKNAREELDSASAIISKLCGAKLPENIELHECELRGDIGGEELCEARTIITVSKIRKTPREYPRRFSQIKKSISQ